MTPGYKNVEDCSCERARNGDHRDHTWAGLWSWHTCTVLTAFPLRRLSDPAPIFTCSLLCVCVTDSMIVSILNSWDQFKVFRLKGLDESPPNMSDKRSLMSCAGNEHTLTVSAFVIILFSSQLIFVRVDSGKDDGDFL